MREIKFRAIAPKLDGKFHYGSFLDNTQTDFDSYIAEDNATYIQIDRDTVGQYTGLKDKNGKEIYEGDIVKGFIPEIANEPERIGIVKFGCYGWIVDFESEKWECKISLVGFCSFRDYEVIGNIYENPELLKGGRHE